MGALPRLLALLAAALSLHAAGGRVPAGVRSIAIRNASGVTATVARPASVRLIVEWFDALPRFVARPCPYLMGPTPPDVVFDFRAAGGDVLLHAVDHAPGTCPGEIAYGNDLDVKYAPLADDSFVARVSRLLGVRLGARLTTATNERLAKRDAAKLLRLARVPGGSRRVSRAPAPELGYASSSPGTPSLAHLHRIWRVREPASAVFAFERAHRPHGSKLTATGTADWGRNSSQQLTFSFPAIAHRVSTRELVVDIVPLTNGWTGIRIDAQDAWVVTRPVGEVVPAGVRMIDIRKGSRLVHRVTAPRKVATIIRRFDALPLSPMGNYPCKILIAGPPERILFRGGPEMQVLARASGFPFGALSGGCNPIAFSAGGHSFPPLLGGRFLIRVEKLLR